MNQGYRLTLNKEKDNFQKLMQVLKKLNIFTLQLTDNTFPSYTLDKIIYQKRRENQTHRNCYLPGKDKEQACQTNPLSNQRL
jgi:hypothetical protein